MKFLLLVLSFILISCGVVHEQDVISNASGNNLKTAQTVLSSEQSINQAIAAMNPEELAKLLSVGADLKHTDSTTGRTYLHDATVTGAIEVVELFVNFGIDVAGKDREGKVAKDIIPDPLNMSDKTFKVEMSDVLDGKKMLPARLDTILLECISSMNPPRLRYIIKRGANVNLTTGTGKRKASALILAINSKNLELVKAIADDSKTDLLSDYGTGITPMKKAIAVGVPEIITYLTARLESKK